MSSALAASSAFGRWESAQPPAVQIHDGGQITPAVAGPGVGNTPTPGLIRCGGCKLASQPVGGIWSFNRGSFIGMGAGYACISGPALSSGCSHDNGPPDGFVIALSASRCDCPQIPAGRKQAVYFTPLPDVLRIHGTFALQVVIKAG